MLILIVSIICGVLLGSVAYIARGDLLEAIVIGFLLGVVIDTIQRAVLRRKFPIRLWRTKTVEELKKEKKASS